MPNHITTILKASAEVIASLKSEESEVDFSKIIPQPPELLKEGVNMSITTLVDFIGGKINLQPTSMLERLQLSNALDCLTGRDGQPLLRTMSDEQFEQFTKSLNSMRKTGSSSWYDWNIANWGTKWGAYSIKVISETEVQFETAWSHPVVIIDALSKKFPEEKIEVEFADEDIGSNLGHYIIHNGEHAGIVIEDPILFALRLNGRVREDGSLMHDEYYRKNEETGRLEYYDRDEEATEETESE